MNWINRKYPNTAYIVEVKYSGDISITECRCKDMPKNRDNSKGFTQGFWGYAEAQRYAKQVADELDIAAII